jgi:chromosome segregation ATPase
MVELYVGAEPAQLKYRDAAGNAEAPAAGNRSEDGPTIAELDFEVRQLRKSLERLERQVRVQRQTQSALVRDQNAAASALQQQSDDADEHAKQVEKNRVGID